MDTFIKLDHKITYNEIDLFNKFSLIQIEEQEQFRNIIYKYDLICIFGLNDFIEDIINEKISILYEKMIVNKEIERLTYKLAKMHNNSDDAEIGFMLLFSYDNLHLFYECICDFLQTKNISIENMEALKKNIY
jgi:hypothetical protein